MYKNSSVESGTKTNMDCGTDMIKSGLRHRSQCLLIQPIMPLMLRSCACNFPCYNLAAIGQNDLHAYNPLLSRDAVDPTNDPDTLTQTC